MSELEFAFQDVLDELDAVSLVAEPFIAPESQKVLAELRGGLKSFASEATARSFDWGIPAERPLRTRVSEGEYEEHSRGSLRIMAEITSVWTIKQVRDGGKKALAARFTLAGKTSTMVRIRPSEGETEVAMWRMEVGDARSPGCHFHVQVLGEADAVPFPKSLSVPRLPAIHATPPAVIEFVMGELFQENWDKHVTARSVHVKRWAPIQRQRLEKLLTWQLKVVRENSLGSPWISLKRGKPEASLFV
jgi:hypothetical protein